MREEDAKGPQELVEKDEKKERLSGIQQERYQREKLRKYQMQRSVVCSLLVFYPGVIAVRKNLPV